MIAHFLVLSRLQKTGPFEGPAVEERERVEKSLFLKLRPDNANRILMHDLFDL